MLPARRDPILPALDQDPESDVESIVAEPCYILDEEEEFQLVDERLGRILG